MGKKVASERYQAWVARMCRAVDPKFREWLSGVKADPAVYAVHFSIVGSLHWTFNSIGYLFSGGKEVTFDCNDRIFQFRRRQGGLGFTMEGLYCLFALLIPIFALLRTPFVKLDENNRNRTDLMFYDPNPGLSRGVSSALSGVVMFFTIVILAFLAVQLIFALVSLSRGWRRFPHYLINSALLAAVAFTRFGFWLFAGMLVIGLFKSEFGLDVVTVERHEHQVYLQKLKRERKAEEKRAAAGSSGRSYPSSRSSYAPPPAPAVSPDEQRRRENISARRKELEDDIRFEEQRIDDLRHEIQKINRSIDDYYKHPGNIMYDLDPEACRRTIRKKEEKIRDSEFTIQTYRRRLEDLDN